MSRSPRKSRWVRAGRVVIAVPRRRPARRRWVRRDEVPSRNPGPRTAAEQPARSPLDEVAALVPGGLDLDGGVADVVPVTQHIAGAVEHGVRVVADLDLQVDA